MWPFSNRFKETIERRRTIAQLGQFVSPEVREEILNLKPGESLPPRKHFLHHVLILIRDDDIELLAQTISGIINAVSQGEGFIENRVGSLVVAIFGAFPSSTPSDPLHLCETVVSQLSERFGQDIKIVYGSGESLLGSLGNGQIMHFGTTPPNFSSRLSIICQMHYGEIRRIDY